MIIDSLKSLIDWLEKFQKSNPEKTKNEQNQTKIVNNIDNANGIILQNLTSTNNAPKDNHQLPILEDKSSTNSSLPAVVAPVDKTFEGIDREVEKALLDKERLSRPLEVVAVEHALDVVRKLTEPQLDILLASAFIYYVPLPGQSIEDILQHLMFNSHYFNKSFHNWNDFSFLESIGCGKLFNAQTLGEIFKIRLNNTDINIDEMQSNPCFQIIKEIWERGLLCNFSLSLMGEYIGLKYYEQKQGIRFNNLASIFS